MDKSLDEMGGFDLPTGIKCLNRFYFKLGLKNGNAVTVTGVTASSR